MQFQPWTHLFTHYWKFLEDICWKERLFPALGQTLFLNTIIWEEGQREQESCRIFFFHYYWSERFCFNLLSYSALFSHPISFTTLKTAAIAQQPETASYMLPQQVKTFNYMVLATRVLKWSSCYEQLLLNGHYYYHKIFFPSKHMSDSPETFLFFYWLKQFNPNWLVSLAINFLNLFHLWTSIESVIGWFNF